MSQPRQTTAAHPPHRQRTTGRATLGEKSDPPLRPGQLDGDNKDGGTDSDRKPRLHHALARRPEGRRPRRRPAALGALLPATRAARAQKLRAGHRSGADADAEDAALSVFDSFCDSAARGRFPQLDDRDDLWRLLVTMTACKVADHARRHGRQKRGGGRRILDEAALDGPGSGGGRAGLDAIVGSEPTPSFAALVAEQYSRLLESLGDESLRRIALLKMEGYTLDEIAAQLGCAPENGGQQAPTDPHALGEGVMSGTRPADDDRGSLAEFEHVVELCDRYEAAWREGRRPRIEDYLTEALESERALLLRELLALELELRSNGGERPEPQEYRERFPGHVELINRILKEAGPSAPHDQQAPTGSYQIGWEFSPTEELLPAKTTASGRVTLRACVKSEPYPLFWA